MVKVSASVPSFVLLIKASIYISAAPWTRDIFISMGPDRDLEELEMPLASRRVRQANRHLGVPFRLAIFKPFSQEPSGSLETSHIKVHTWQRCRTDWVKLNKDECSVSFSTRGIPAVHATFNNFDFDKTLRRQSQTSCRLHTSGVQLSIFVWTPGGVRL